MHRNRHKRGQQDGKVDKRSFMGTYREAAMKPEKLYTFILQVNERGYLPFGVKPDEGGPEENIDRCKIFMAKATGYVIGNLEHDDKVVSVQAPPIGFPN